jgi:SAM-dependent methyltransferase
VNSSFTDVQYELAYPEDIEFHWWSLVRASLIRRLVFDESSPDALFLEVGCGKGLEVMQLRRAGINAYGVELAPIAPLEEVAGFVESGIDATELPLEHRMRVTGLLILDVIEHIADPQSFLNDLAVTFPNVDVVVVTVPARQEIWSNYDEFYGHERRYSLQMLEDLALDIGWRKAKIGYFFRLPYLPARLLAILGIDRNIRLNPPTAKLRWFHRVISYLLRLEYFVLPRHVIGTSAFAVFRK